jgi:hypothetical protein
MLRAAASSYTSPPDNPVTSFDDAALGTRDDTVELPAVSSGSESDSDRSKSVPVEMRAAHRCAQKRMDRSRFSTAAPISCERRCDIKRARLSTGVW